LPSFVVKKSRTPCDVNAVPHAMTPLEWENLVPTSIRHVMTKAKKIECVNPRCQISFRCKLNTKKKSKKKSKSGLTARNAPNRMTSQSRFKEVRGRNRATMIAPTRLCETGNGIVWFNCQDPEP